MPTSLSQNINYQLFFEKSNALLCVANLDGYFISYNQAFRDTLGYDDAFLLRTPFIELVHPEDRESTIREYERLVKEELDTTKFLNRYQVMGGGYRFFEWHTVPQVENGYLVCVVIDVTEQEAAKMQLQRSEQYLAYAQSAAKIGYWSVEFDPVKMMWSEETYRIHEVPIGTELDIADGINFYDQPSQPIIEAAFNQCVTDGTPFDLELGIITAQQNWKCVRAIGLAELEKEQIKRVYGVFQDVTDNYKYRKELNTLNIHLADLVDDLTHANKDLEQFVYIASHDLQEPLRTILSHAALIEQNDVANLSETGQYSLARINLTTRRLKNVVYDLLEYSRAGRNADPTTMDLNEEINQITEDLAQIVQEKKARIEVGSLPKVEARAHDIRALFQNLISNALKFSREGIPPSITIGVKQTAEGKFWEFSVQDNGIGIKAHNLEKIFTLFKRLHRKEKFEGTGIGLALCQKIVHTYQGEIWVESVFGEGATFYFTLPVVEA